MIVGDHASGSSAVRRVPPSGGLWISRAPPTRRHPVSQAAQARPRLGIGAADTVVGDLHPQQARAGHRTQRDRIRSSVLRDVRERLGGQEVCGHLDRLRQAPFELDRDGDRDRRLPREAAQRGGESGLGQDRRVDPPRESAQFGQRAGELFRSALERGLELGGGIGR